MLLKLIKYDMKSTYAKILLTFLVFALVCIVAPLLLVQFQKTGAFVYVTLTGTFGCITMLVLIFIFLFQRYSSNLYSSEGYLMFALPTDGKRLLASKLLVAVIWFLLGSALFVGGLAAVLYVFSFEPSFIKIFSKLFASMEINLNTVSCALVSYIAGSVLFIIEIYFSISFSKLAIWRKFGVLMGFVTFFAVNILESIPNLLNNGLSDFNKGFKEGVTYSVESYAGVSETINIGKIATEAYQWGNAWRDVLIASASCVVLFIATTWLLNRKTSLK
jgi:hypothetical protein